MKSRTLITKGRLRAHMNDIIALSGLILCLLIFSTLAPIIKGINILNPRSLAFKSIVADGVIYSVLAGGAAFIYALGAMDISVGAQMSLYSMLLIRIYNMNGSSPVSIMWGVVCILVIAMLCGATNSIVASALDMKPIITSLILQFFIYGIAAILMLRWNADSVAMGFDIGTASKTHFAIFRNPLAQLAVMVAFYLFIGFLFNYAKLGRYVRAIGANAECARQAGVHIVYYKLMAYLTFALAIVTASVLFVATKGSTDAASAKGYEMKIMISLILGGMPLSGGMKSKVRSAVVGGFTYALISRSFVYLGVPDKFTTLFVALIYIVVVLITCRSHSKVLPR